MNKSADPDVPMPLMAVYFARMAAVADDRPEEAALLDEILRSSAQATGASVLAAATAAAASPLLPFRREAVDQWVAATAREGIPGPGVCLFSEASFVRAGYLQVSNAAVEYVESNRGAGDLAEILNPHLVRQTSGRLKESCSAPPTVALPADGSCILEFHLPEWLTVPDYRFDRDGRWKVSLVRPGASRERPPQSVSVHYRSLSASSPGKYALKGTTEIMMEIHAGGVEGQWLHLSAPGFVLLGRVPDLSEEGQSTVASFHPRNVFASVMGHGSSPSVPVPAPLARLLVKRHFWCSASAISDWLHLLVNPVT